MRLEDCPLPLLGVAARSGTGKTTLLERLIPLLRDRGVRVALVKHSHHDFEIDRPGKDSDRLRRAGAGQVLLASPWRTAWIREGDGVTEPALEELLERLDLNQADLVLVEGFRHLRFPKLEIYRSDLHRPLLCADDPSILAVVCDRPPDPPPDRPLLDLGRPDQVAQWILEWMGRRA